MQHTNDKTKEREEFNMVQQHFLKITPFFQVNYKRQIRCISC